MSEPATERLRLIFVGGAEGPSTDYARGTIDFPMPGARPRRSSAIEGADAGEVLDAWNALPAWADYEPLAFRDRIIRFCGAEIRLPAAENEILEAVVVATGPGALRLEIVS